MIGSERLTERVQRVGAREWARHDAIVRDAGVD
jgi:hypothetical protein